MLDETFWLEFSFRTVYQSFGVIGKIIATVIII